MNLPPIHYLGCRDPQRDPDLTDEELSLLRLEKAERQLDIERNETPISLQQDRVR